VSNERRIWLLTDSPEQALAELRERRRATGEAGWDMAEVRRMPDPPQTACRFAVFHQTPSTKESKRAS